LAPLQYAICESGGCEKIYTTISACFQSKREGYCALFWDVVNAFNSANRKTFLDALHRTNPEMSPYMNLWYSGAAPIRFKLSNGEVKIIYCSQGTIQGSPLGGLCFCYGFDVPLRKILQRVSDKVLIMADMDDLSAFCPISEAVHVCQVVKEELEKEGLVLHESKNYAYTTPINYDDLKREFGENGNMTISSDGAVVGKTSDEGVRLLGIPFGSVEFVERFLSKRLLKTIETLELMPKLNNMQVANLLLRLCINQRNVFLNRTLPPSDVKNHFNGKLDDKVQQCFQQIFQISKTDDIYVQYQTILPLNLGGIGITSNELVADSAHLGSLALCLNSAFSRLLAQGVIVDEEEMKNLPMVITGKKLWDEVHTRLNIEPEDSFDAFLQFPVPKMQQKLADLIHKDLYKLIVAEADPRTISRIQSSGGKGSSGFLTTCPTDDFNKFSNTQMEISVKRRLGLALTCLADNQLMTRCICGADLDVLGDHLICCRKGNDRFLVHFGLVHNLASILREAELAIQTEKPLIALGQITPQLSGKRADLLITFRNSTPYLADVSVIHSTPLNFDSLNKYAKKPGAASEIREQQKITKYLESAKQVAHNFVPFIFESYGRMGKATSTFMKKIAQDCICKQLSRDDKQLTAQLLNRWWMRLSCSLQKGIANLILSRSFRILESRALFPKNKISVNLLRDLT